MKTSNGLSQSLHNGIHYQHCLMRCTSIWLCLALLLAYLLLSLNVPQNSRSIKKVVTLLIPGLTPSLLGLPPIPTSATINPNIPLAIPLPETSSNDIPYIASTFSHACPTRAPGEPTRMHSVLSAFFHGPVSGEEKKKRLQQRVNCKPFSCIVSCRFDLVRSRTCTWEGPCAICNILTADGRE